MFTYVAMLPWKMLRKSMHMLYKLFGNTCDILRGDSYKPEILKSIASFSYFSETTNEYAYKFMTDATHKSEIVFLWTNQKRLNRMNFHIDAFIDSKYNFPEVPPLPNYIRNATFGIVESRLEVEHLKGSKYEGYTYIFRCEEPSNTNPIADRPLNCRFDNHKNIRAIDSGDIYKLKFTVKTGGFRELIDGNGNYFKRDIYTGVQSQHFMEYRFDYDVPVHCTELGNCNKGEDKPLYLEKDITKVPIKVQWNGWSDNSLSGVRSYAVEFWKMEYSSDYDGLREPDILPNFNPSPPYITTILELSKINYLSYEPREPGGYSVILEVADRANNTRYARRIAICDNTSEITINPDHKLLATSASPASYYVWQTTPNSKKSQTTIITISWEKHFINKDHENGHFLAKVLDYTPRLSDNIDRINYKKIASRFDDLDGDRNKIAIPNINSIVLFEIADGKPSDLPPKSWKPVFPLKENAIFVLNGVDIRDGDSHQVWVKAHDVMGNTKIDSTVIYFDLSPPKIFELTFELNVDDGVYPFSSRVTVSAKDDGSGISIISFTFVECSSGVLTEQINVTKKEEQKRQCDDKPKECYCIRKEECFMIDTTLDINNCWLKKPIHNVKSGKHKLEITVYNLAMLPAKITYDIVDSLHGIREYLSPSHLTIRNTTDESLSISWIQAPTCYERAGILIRLFNPDNTTKEFQVHKDATTFDITGLSQTTNYWFELYTKYGNDSDL